MAPAVVFIHVFDANKASVPQRDVVPVSSKKEEVSISQAQESISEVPRVLC